LTGRLTAYPSFHQRGLLASPRHRAAFFFTHSALDQENIWGVFIGYLLAPGLKASSPILTALFDRHRQSSQIHSSSISDDVQAALVQVFKCSPIPCRSHLSTEGLPMTRYEVFQAHHEPDETYSPGSLPAFPSGPPSAAAQTSSPASAALVGTSPSSSPRLITQPSITTSRTGSPH
jgi:hypothetical protein